MVKITEEEKYDPYNHKVNHQHNLYSISSINYQLQTTMKIQIALSKLNAFLALTSSVASASDMFQSTNLFRGDGADEGGSQNIVGGTVVSCY